jgi:hypothetical protein
MLQLVRRVGLALGVMLAVLAWSWVDTGPFVTVSLPQGGRHAPEVTREVSGAGWQALYADLLALERGPVNAAQAKRLPEYARSWSRGRSLLTYRLDEPPVADLRDSVSGKTGALRLVLDTPTGGAALDARIRSLDWDDFQLGSGLSEYLGPVAMRFPWRHLAWLPLLGGLLVYLALPRRRLPTATIRYPGWRVVLTDVVWLLVFVPFFALPVLIVGAFQPALMAWSALTAVFWLFACAGLFLLYIAAWYAVFSVDLAPSALSLTTLTGRHTVAFAEVAAFSRVRHRPPVWLVRALWLVAVLGRRGSGQALLLSQAETGGLALTLWDGGRVYFWITDTLGSPALAGAKRIETALTAAGVAFRPEVEERRDFWPPTIVRG